MLHLQNKNIVLGISSSIALYKAASLASLLKKQGASVHVLMTPNATKLMSPVLFESLTGNPCHTDTFDHIEKGKIEHITLAGAADLFLIVPGTANVIAKLAHGVCDDMLTSTCLAATCPKIVAPAMNVHMFENPVTQDNIQKLKGYGFSFVEPVTGLLACGDIGNGKLAEPEQILEVVITAIGYEKDLLGKQVLVSAGATKEAIDPVRFISNRSTGKMGLAIAKAAKYRGANVCLVLGENRLNEADLEGLRVIHIESALELREAMLSEMEEADWVVMSAAVADFRSAQTSDQKMKKKETGAKWTVELTQNPDILQEMGEKKRSHQLLCGFAMETQDLILHAREKFIRKKVDLLVANDLKKEGAGFATETNEVTFILKDRERFVSLRQKFEVGTEILNTLKECEQKEQKA